MSFVASLGRLCAAAITCVRSCNAVHAVAMSPIETILREVLADFQLFCSFSFLILSLVTVVPLHKNPVVSCSHVTVRVSVCMCVGTSAE